MLKFKVDKNLRWIKYAYPRFTAGIIDYLRKANSGLDEPVVYIAGGSVRKFFDGCKLGDIDMYFSTKQAWMECPISGQLKANMFVETILPYAGRLQLIGFTAPHTMTQVLNSFDITAVQMAYDGRYLWVKERYCIEHARKKLVYLANASSSIGKDNQDKMSPRLAKYVLIHKYALGDQWKTSFSYTPDHVIPFTPNYDLPASDDGFWSQWKTGTPAELSKNMFGTPMIIRELF